MSVIRHPSTGTAVTVKQWRYTATGGETTLSGTDGFGLSLSYTVGAEEVYINGVLLVRGTDYTASTGTSITGLTALVAGDVATVMSANSFNVANAIAASTVTAKGDLIVANGASSVSNLAVGSDGTTLVANSSASTGVAWAGPIATAGKNTIINGGFEIWQRGTTFTNPGSGGGVYSADRWQAFFGQNGTVTQDTTLLLAGTKYGARVTATTSTAGNTDLFQIIEDVHTIPLQGKTVTFSAYAAGTSGKTPYLEITYSTTANDTLFNISSAVGVSSSITTTGSFQRITVTGTVPSNAKTLRVGLRSNSSLGLNEYLTWSNAQLEIGSVATPFSRNASTLQGELAACQRYYQNINAEDMWGAYSQSTQVAWWYKNAVTMRTNPTPTYPSSFTNIIDKAGVGYASATSIVTGNTSPTVCLILANGAGSASVGQPAGYVGSTIQLSAEL